MSIVINSLTGLSATAASGHREETSRPGLATRFLLWCVWCSERSHQRRALAQLDDRLLSDIGVTPQQAIAEAAKPFWK